MKFPFVFKQKRGTRLIFFMADETKNNETPLIDLTDPEEVRKAIIANEILNRKY